MENEFLERLRKRIKEGRLEETPSDWICRNTTLSQGRYFSFRNHKFQIDITNDFSPEMYVKKLSQVGLTEVSIRKAIYFLHKHPGTAALYALPDLNLKKKQCQTRILPIFNRDFPADKNNPQIRNNDVLQLGDSFLYVSGNSESDSFSVTQDIQFLDEYDLSDASFLSLVRSRTQASEYRIRQGFSTPTFADFGISRDFASSDCRQYLVRCPHCNRWQLPEYNLDYVVIPGLSPDVNNLITDIDSETASTLDLDNAYVRCEKCGKPLDLGDNADREWVPTYPDRINVRGYQVKPFSSNLLPIKYLVTTVADYVKRDRIQFAYNTVLGEEYTGDASTRLEVKDIQQCFEDSRSVEGDLSKPSFVGVDVGVNCHLCILQGDYDVVHFEVIPFDNLLERFKDLDKQYNIVAGLADRYPQISLIYALRDLSNNRIYPVVYSDGKDLEPHRDISNVIDYFKLNRTDSLDRVRDYVNRHLFHFYGYGILKNVITEQLRDMWRDSGLEKDAAPRWVKMNNNDHFFHTLGYAVSSKKMYDYLNSTTLTEPDPRSCVDLVGAFRNKYDHYNDNLLQYRTVKRRY